MKREKILKAVQKYKNSNNEEKIVLKSLAVQNKSFCESLKELAKMIELISAIVSVVITGFLDFFREQKDFVAIQVYSTNILKASLIVLVIAFLTIIIINSKKASSEALLVAYDNVDENADKNAEKNKKQKDKKKKQNK